MKRTGFRRSWCEKAVRDARNQAFSAPHEDHAPYGRRRPYRPAARDGGLANANRPGRGSRIGAQRRAPALTRRNPHHVNRHLTPATTPAPVPAALDPSDGEDDADVLFLAAARDSAPAPDGGNAGRGGRPPALPPAPGDRPDGDDARDDDDADRESVLIGRVLPGPAVDPPDEPRPFRPRGSQPRPPVIPPWLASRAALAASLRWAAKEARYHAGFHAVRAPKYAAKTALYAVPGAVRTVARLVRWASRGRGQLAPAAGRRRPRGRRAVAGAGCPPPAAGPAGGGRS